MVELAPGSNAKNRDRITHIIGKYQTVVNDVGMRIEVRPCHAQRALKGESIDTFLPIVDNYIAETSIVEFVYVLTVKAEEIIVGSGGDELGQVVGR